MRKKNQARKIFFKNKIYAKFFFENFKKNFGKKIFCLNQDGQDFNMNKMVILFHL